MSKSKIKSICILVLSLIICFGVLAGCGQKLSSDFDEAEVKSAAENVITLVNEKDSEGLREMSTVQMKEGLTDDLLNKVYEAIGEGGAFKKAIVESMKKKYHRKWFDETGPLYTIEVSLLQDVATLTIDTSGAGLHKRGYRKLSTSAPLKETLAAAMINLSYWNSERILFDPFCGSGTIPIEAALIGLNAAPGLHREFAAESWLYLPQRFWSEARQEAEDLIRRDLKLNIRGTDIDPKVMSIARYHAKLAGVNDYVSFQQMPVADLRTKKKYGCLICNPPYGERLEDVKEVEQLYRQMGVTFKPLDTWSLYVLTSYRNFERLFGRRADRRRKLYNGRIECQYYQFYGPRPPRRGS
jgi:putative N6-adenine-specific DNA methylase